MAARRTTMNIDHDLVAQAQDILGTDTATATVHRALEDVIRQFHISQLLDRGPVHITNEEIELEDTRVPDADGAGPEDDRAAS